MALDAKELFSKNLRELMEASGKTQTDLVDAFNLTHSTVSNWVNGKKYPRADKIQMLAEYFCVPMSRLMKEEEILLMAPGISKKTGHFVDHTTPLQLQALSEFFLNQKETTLDNLIETLKTLPAESYVEVNQFLLFVKFKYKLREGNDG